MTTPSPSANLTERLLVEGRTFVPARGSDPRYLELCAALAADANFLGEYAVDAAPGTTLRAGVLRDGFTLALVVAPAGRAPYAELTTFVVRPPSPTLLAITTNGRADPTPPRPESASLERHPGAAPADLRRRHLERLATLPRPEETVRTWIEPSERGVLRAIASYLRAISF
jgi:hypothetical protein